MLNLEPLAALAANEMVDTRPLRKAEAKDADNIITKSLAVLAEQGVYAFGLFLATRKRDEDREIANNIHQSLCRLLQSTQLCEEKNCPQNSTDWPAFYRNLGVQRNGETVPAALHRLLLTKQLLETTLTYGRYAAKAQNTGN